jgi:hypothetical protein
VEPQDLVDFQFPAADAELIAKLHAGERHSSPPKVTRPTSLDDS